MDSAVAEVGQPINMHNAHPVYRPDIDGLRAIAILSVVIFHAFPTKLRGGFVGVDIFFVISGFLISSIIFRSLQRGDFSLGEFYARRVRRIFPALILVLAASYTVGWFVLLPDEFKQLGKHMAAGAGFVQNIVLHQEAGYFDTASELKPLMHLWSLSIEEQFYLIFPVLIWGAWRLGLNALSVVLLLILLSFGLNLGGIEKNATKVFFMPHTRFWELLAGSVLAYVQLFKSASLTYWLQRGVFHPLVFRHPPAAERRDAILNNLLAFGGLLLIVAADFGLHKGKLYPGGWALFPVLGACLLILAGPGAWVNRKILANRWVVFVGLISYPLYLWHWPLLSFARLMEGETPSRNIRMAVVALSFVLAWLTYRLIERPIRLGGKTWVKTAVLCLLIGLVGYVGYNAYQRQGLVFRQVVTNKLAIINDLKWDGLWESPGCIAKYGFSPCVVSGDLPTVIILGDSHGNHLYPGLASLGQYQFLSAGTCAPLDGVSIHVKNNQANHPCAKTDFLAKNMAVLASEKQITTAILSSFWRAVLDGNILNDRERAYWGGTTLVSTHQEESNLSRQELVLNGLKRTIKQLREKNLKIIFVRDTFDIADELTEYCKLSKPIPSANCTIPRAEFASRRVPEDWLIHELLTYEPALRVVDPIENFCDRDRCFLMRDHTLYYRDQHHLSVSGSKLMATLIQQHL